MDQSEFEELLRSSSRPPGLMTSRKSPNPCGIFLVLVLMNQPEVEER
jgi:hypothetical protein